MAIKGRTKRSQGRPARRVTPGPRPVVVDRRDHWYKAPAFAVTVAVVALLLTGYLAVERLQYGWARDDVARFSQQLQEPAQELTAIATSGTGDTPGFVSSVTDFNEDNLEPAELSERAELWGVQIQEATQDLTSITLGDRIPPAGGLPASDLGGHVYALAQVQDTYVAAAGLYEDAAATWSLAGKAEGELQQSLMDRAQRLADRGQTVFDLAVTQLAALRVHYDLPVAQQLPAESSSLYSERSGGL